jgi:flagellar motility protein MotE (MotC chaperone)
MAGRLNNQEGNVLLIIVILVVILAGAGAGLFFFAPDVLRGIPGIGSLLPEEEVVEEVETEDAQMKRLRSLNKELERQLKEQAVLIEEKDTRIIEQQNAYAELEEKVAKDVDETTNKYVKILEKMEPVSAAGQITTLTPDIQAEILIRMKDKAAAAILEAMESRQASQVTQEVMSRLKELRDREALAITD